MSPGQAQAAKSVLTVTLHRGVKPRPDQASACETPHELDRTGQVDMSRPLSLRDLQKLNHHAGRGGGGERQGKSSTQSVTQGKSMQHSTSKT